MVNLKDFPNIMVHCLGWQYNDPCYGSGLFFWLFVLLIYFLRFEGVCFFFVLFLCIVFICRLFACACFFFFVFVVYIYIHKFFRGFLV